MLQLGYSLAGSATLDGLVGAGQHAEALGFDLVSVGDAPVMPDYMPMAVDLDPIPALGALAATTTRVKLATTVLLLPHREPITTAKALASIHALSGGRLIWGVGSGWRREEMSALGLAGVHLGKRLDHDIDLMLAWFNGDKDFDGAFRHWKSATPKPVLDTMPELWIGGGSEAARARALRRNAVWHPPFFGNVGDETFEAEVRAFRAAGGVGVAPRFGISPIEGVPGFLGGVEPLVAGLQWMADIGVTHLSLILGFDWDMVRATSEWFITEVEPRLKDVGLR